MPNDARVCELDSLVDRKLDAIKCHSSIMHELDKSAEM